MRDSLIRGSDAAFLVISSSPLERGKSYELEFTSQGTVVQKAGNNVYFVGARENWYPNLSRPVRPLRGDLPLSQEPQPGGGGRGG